MNIEPKIMKISLGSTQVSPAWLILTNLGQINTSEKISTEFLGLFILLSQYINTKNVKYCIIWIGALLYK